MCITPQFDVSDDTHDWLTQNLFIGRGRLAGLLRIEYELYRVVWQPPRAQARVSRAQPA